MVGWSCFLSEKHFAKPVGLAMFLGLMEQERADDDGEPTIQRP